MQDGILRAIQAMRMAAAARVVGESGIKEGMDYWAIQGSNL
jgi:hypothetical protein